MQSGYEQGGKSIEGTQGRKAAKRVSPKLELQHGDVSRHTENSLQKELTSANKENERLQAEVSNANEATESLSKEVKILSEQVCLNAPPPPTLPMICTLLQVRAAKATGFVPKCGRSRVKSPSKCMKHQQRNIKRKREASCRELLQWLENDGYKPAKEQER